MRRGLVAFSALALIGVGLIGCGRSPFEAREPWRAQAEEACIAQKLVPATEFVARVPEINGPGACGITYPFRLTALGEGSVSLTSKLTLGCPMIPRIDGWLAEVVQPAAATYFGSEVIQVRSGSYSCRPRNNQRGAKLSEHSFGNAVDVFAFRLADGREVTVLKGWRGAPEEQEFLREVFVGACQHFTTVLGPGADMFHHDHFHMDLARHDPRGQRRVCKPILKFTPRLDRTGPGGAVPRNWGPPVEQAPIDQEEDLHDPFAISKKGGAPATRVARAPDGPAASLQQAPAPVRPLPPVTSVGPDRPLYPPNRSLGPPVYGAAPPQRPPGPAVAYRRDEPLPSRAPLVLQPQLWSGQEIY